MSDPTFKAIEHKVNLALCLVAVVIAVGLTFSNLATAKSMADTEYRFLANNTAVEFTTAKSRGDKHHSKPSANTAKLERQKNIKSSNINIMPVMDELAPAFKKTRLI